MKLWHDDIRPAPEGWVWARTNEQAQEHLLTGTVEEISLDHDLGFHDIEIPNEIDPDDLMDLLVLRGVSEQTGLQLVDWMIEHDLVPKQVRIHSWNPDGAKRMAYRLSDCGFYPVVSPYVPVLP
jgi:hypothetical protein